ncbi:MAG: succinate dehydrogenase, hydrophobic membrane anchor protein [Lautropia sp.]
MTTKRIVTGAHYGLRDWLGQRVTAVILTVYSLYLLFTVLTVPRLEFRTWAGLFLSPFMKVATLLAMLALIYHAWVGIRDVYMDYIRPTMIRLLLEVLTILLLIGYACWTAVILWRV